MTPIPVAQVFGTDTERIVAIQKNKIEVVRRLTDALFDYLTFYERLGVETANEPKPVYRPSDEEIDSAIKQRDAIESQVLMIRERLSELNDDDPQTPFLKTGILFPLEQQLEQADRYLSGLQKAMDA